MGRAKLTIKDWKKRALSAEKSLDAQKEYFETICNNHMEEIRIKGKKLEQAKKDWYGLQEQLVFVESELQEANNDNSSYDDVILALGNTINNLRAKLKRRNVNDSLNRNYELVNHSLEDCNAMKPKIEAGSVFRKENEK